jgi:hypothetical protein
MEKKNKKIQGKGDGMKGRNVVNDHYIKVAGDVRKEKN